MSARLVSLVLASVVLALGVAGGAVAAQRNLVEGYLYVHDQSGIPVAYPWEADVIEKNLVARYFSPNSTIEERREALNILRRTDSINGNIIMYQLEFGERQTTIPVHIKIKFKYDRYYSEIGPIIFDAWGRRFQNYNLVIHEQFPSSEAQKQYILDTSNRIANADINPNNELEITYSYYKGYLKRRLHDNEGVLGAFEILWDLMDQISHLQKQHPSSGIRWPEEMIKDLSRLAMSMDFERLSTVERFHIDRAPGVGVRAPVLGEVPRLLRWPRRAA